VVSRKRGVRFFRFVKWPCRLATRRHPRGLKCRRSVCHTKRASRAEDKRTTLSACQIEPPNQAGDDQGGEAVDEPVDGPGDGPGDGPVAESGDEDVSTSRTDSHVSVDVYGYKSMGRATDGGERQEQD
jgi:hypothetical protein